ncbi:uncharacterized protein LOC135475700 [Liolophura sinensis]|uniref:uncharacterized protein LOC135475700 n=1 Tax=Liolophura sinensis TaxID=3198878 RepID=UPI0031590260
MSHESRNMKVSTSTASSHKTFIPFGNSVVLKRCVDLNCGCKSSFHCPFCDLSHFKATKPSRVQDHLEESHWPNAVQYKDLFILRCFHLCAEDIGGHYHCPVCPELIDRRFKFVSHLQAHLEDKGENVHLAYAPDAKQPPCLVYRDFTLRRCEDSCWNNPEPGLGHYHCPGCDNIQTTTSSMANHLRKCFALIKMKQEGSINTRTLENPQQVFAEYWHKSIVRNTSDIPIRRCCSRKCCNRLYHCPLCTYERTDPNTIANLRIHFSHHQDNAVTHRGYTILACHLDCEQYGVANPALHYHCPYCGTTKSGLAQFSSHLDTCRQLSSREMETEDAPETEISSVLENEDVLCQTVDSDDDMSGGEMDRSLPRHALDSKAQIEMFDSVTATLSQPFLKVFNFATLVTAEKLLSDVAGATSVEWISSPGTDPSRPVLSVKGCLANILKAESYLFEKFLQINNDKSVSVKTTKPDWAMPVEKTPDNFPASPSSSTVNVSPVTSATPMTPTNVATPFSSLHDQPAHILELSRSESRSSPPSRLKTMPLLNNFGSISGSSVAGIEVLLTKSTNHDHRYSSTDPKCRISSYADLGSTWSAGKSQPHLQKGKKLQFSDKHKDQGTDAEDTELLTANEKSKVFSSEVLYCIVKTESQAASRRKSTFTHSVLEESPAVQEKRYSTRKVSKGVQGKTEVQTETQNLLEENGALPEKLSTGQNKAIDTVKRSTTVKDCTKSSPKAMSSDLVSVDTAELINSPTNGEKRLSETLPENRSPKRYFTRGHRVDTSMFRKQNKAKDEPSVLTNSRSTKSSKASRKDRNPEMRGTKDEGENVNEDIKVAKQGSICTGKEKTQVFLLNDLPDDIKAALPSTSKITTVGNQQVIYMNHMSETVKQFLESRSSLKASEAKSQSLEFNELPENLKRLLSSTAQSANISLTFIPSLPGGPERGSSFNDGKDVRNQSSLALNSHTDATVESCYNPEDSKGRPSAYPSPKTATLQAVTSRASENSSKPLHPASLSSDELTNASQDLANKMFGLQTERKSASPVNKSEGMRIPALIGTRQIISSQSTPASSGPSVSSNLTEQSKVVLRKYPALPLPNFLGKQSCYIPHIEVGLSFTDVGLVVERTSLKQKNKELSQTHEKMSSDNSSLNIRRKEKAQKVSEMSLEVDVLASSSNSPRVYSESEMPPQCRPVLNEVETLKADKNIEAIELCIDNDATVIVNKCMTCPVCGVRYFKPERLAAHIMFSHYKYKCEVCFAVLTDKDSLVNHLRSVHNATCQPRKRETTAPRSEICKCGHCNKRFTNRRKLDGHQHKAHGAIIRCSICNKICTDIYRLTSHINVRHFKQGATVCDICGKEFPIERYMNSHRRRHFQEKKHACPTCGKKFLDTNTLKDHIETHKPAEDRRYRYICSFCGKRFNSKRSFIDHTNIHTGNRPHVCKKCGKSFSYLTILRKHEKTKHDDRRPFECELCSKAFKMKANLKAHMVTHTGISRFTCPFCRRCFGTAAICKTHISKCKVSKAFKHDSDPNTEAVQAMQMSVVTNLQNLAEDSTLVAAMQMALGNQQTVELQPTGSESEEVLQETFMYMCSACSQTFDNIAAAELHINQCQGATSSQEIWCEQDILQ